MSLMEECIGYMYLLFSLSQPKHLLIACFWVWIGTDWMLLPLWGGTRQGRLWIWFVLMMLMLMPHFHLHHYQSVNTRTGTWLNFFVFVLPHIKTTSFQILRQQGQREVNSQWYMKLLLFLPVSPGSLNQILKSIILTYNNEAWYMGEYLINKKVYTS